VSSRRLPLRVSPVCLYLGLSAASLSGWTQAEVGCWIPWQQQQHQQQEERHRQIFSPSFIDIISFVRRADNVLYIYLILHSVLLAEEAMTIYLRVRGAAFCDFWFLMPIYLGILVVEVAPHCRMSQPFSHLTIQPSSHPHHPTSSSSSSSSEATIDQKTVCFSFPSSPLYNFILCAFSLDQVKLVRFWGRLLYIPSVFYSSWLSFSKKKMCAERVAAELRQGKILSPKDSHMITIRIHFLSSSKPEVTLKFLQISLKDL